MLFAPCYKTKNVYGYNRMGIRNMMKNNASDTAYAEFNSMGKILWLKDPLGNEIDYEYDKLGRNTEHSIKPGGIPTCVGILTVQYAYDEQKKGMLASISGSGHTQSFSYDDHCRINCQNLDFCDFRMTGFFRKLKVLNIYNLRI